MPSGDDYVKWQLRSETEVCKTPLAGAFRVALNIDEPHHLPVHSSYPFTLDDLSEDALHTASELGVVGSQCAILPQIAPIVFDDGDMISARTQQFMTALHEPEFEATSSRFASSIFTHQQMRIQRENKEVSHTMS